MKWPWTKTFPKAVVGGEDADERARLNGAVYAKMWSNKNPNATTLECIRKFWKKRYTTVEL